jgi:hypothetical protein
MMLTAAIVGHLEPFGRNHMEPVAAVAKHDFPCIADVTGMMVIPLV